MLRIKPITEKDAEGRVQEMYASIRQTLGLQSVPLVFQYLASFPSYFDSIWKQARHNLHDETFQRESREISEFAQSAINSIYTPSHLVTLFLEKIEGGGEKTTLWQFITNLSTVNASLYLLSLAVRESLKGRFIGIKLIGDALDESEKRIFNDLSDGFFPEGGGKEQTTSFQNISQSSKDIQNTQSNTLATTTYGEFFKIMEWEMDRMLKREDYLTRRVELERFALSKLHLLKQPVESSFAAVSRFSADNPDFPELLFLIAELFPTQSPFKLLSSSVMKKALIHKAQNSDTDSRAILLPSSEG